MPRFDINVPTIFGRGTAKTTGEEAKKLGMTKVLFLHGPVLPKASIKIVADSLTEAGIEYIEYGGVQENVPDYTIDEAIALVQENGGVDGLIGLGGGSTMDTTAVVNMMLNNPPPVSQYYIRNGGLPKNAGYPYIQIPTTSGTGAESTMASVVYDRELDLKCPLFNKICLLATAAIIDPELALTMPRDLTASTGYDAFSHAFESFTTNWETMSPASDAMNKEAMRLLVEYLPLAVDNLDNIDYREKVAYGAVLAGIGTGNAKAQKGHCFGHAIGSRTHGVPHGVTIAAALPHVAEHSSPYRYDRCKFVAEVFGIEVPEGMSGEALGKVLHDALRAFEKRVGVPGLKQYGVTRAQIMSAIDLMVKDILFRNNEQIMSEEKAISILTEICDFYELD